VTDEQPLLLKVAPDAGRPVFSLCLRTTGFRLVETHWSQLPLTMRPVESACRAQTLPPWPSSVYVGFASPVAGIGQTWMMPS
jgi:hypothetical protein